MRRAAHAHKQRDTLPISMAGCGTAFVPMNCSQQVHQVHQEILNRLENLR
jgi:hypothetical protein